MMRTARLKPLIAYKWSGWHIAERMAIYHFLQLEMLNLTSKTPNSHSTCSFATKKVKSKSMPTSMRERLFVVFIQSEQFEFSINFSLPKNLSIENATIVSTETYVELSVVHNAKRKKMKISWTNKNKTKKRELVVGCVLFISLFFVIEFCWNVFPCVWYDC